MIDSYRNISFRGESRGEWDFNYYSNLLKNDLELLGENTGKYAEKFCDKVMAIYRHKARQASAMIVGPAKFKPNTKAMDSEVKAMEHFSQWRERYFRLVNRVRKVSPSEDIAKHLIEIEKLEALKAKYKAEGYSSRDFRISNTNAKIRYYKKKIEALEARIKLQDSFEETVIPNGKVYQANDRIVVEHFDKPSREVIDLVKRHGFRFSPKTKTWVRQFTGNAVHSTRQLIEALNKAGSNE